MPPYRHPTPAASCRVPVAVIVFTIFLILIGTGYYLADRFSGRRHLVEVRRNLEATGALRPIPEIVPPPTPAALANGKRLLDALADLRQLNKANPAIMEGPTAMRLIAPGVAVRAGLESSPALTATKPAKAVTWEELREQIQAGAAILAEARVLTREPLAFAYDYDSLVYNDALGRTQQLLAWLRADTILRLHDNDLPGALEDFTCSQKISSALGDIGTVIYTALYTGILSYHAIPLTWEILQQPGLTEPNLAHLEQLIAADDFVALARRSLEIEIAQTSGQYRRMLQKGEPMSGYYPVGILSKEPMLKARDVLWCYLWADEDQARLLLGWKIALEQAGVLIATKNLDTSRSIMTESLAKPSNFNLWRYPATFAYNAPGLALSIILQTIRTDTTRQLALTAIALERYHLAHAAYPPDLAALVPTYLPAQPPDWYDGHPLKYRLLPDGHYLLYSVGEDGRDDHGDPSPLVPKTSPTLTSSRDIVWPRAGP